MVKHQEIIKKIFPNPKQLLTLKEFNKMTGRFDKNKQQNNLRDKQDDPDYFIDYII